MEYRNLGGSGLKVPVLMLGTATFGGGSEFFKKWGTTDVAEATSLVDAALDMGCNMFDTADAYSRGLSETILGKAMEGRREKCCLRKKWEWPWATVPMMSAPHARGSSIAARPACGVSARITSTCINSIPSTRKPRSRKCCMRSTLSRAGKIRYFGVSNYSGWHLMKMLALADKHSLPKPVTHQVYYTLTDRDFEWELMPLGLDQNVGTLVWSPLAGAKLSGKVGRNKTPPEGSRAGTDASWDVPESAIQNYGRARTDFARTAQSIPRVALAWLLSRPTVSSIVIGARNVTQLRDNLAAADLRISANQIDRLDAASATACLPYWHQRRTSLARNPPPVG